MKKSILVAAIGAAVVAAPTFAADKLVLSGEMDFVIANQKTGAENTSAYNEVLDNGNFKISGDEDLGGGLGGFFFVETGLADTGGDSDGSYGENKAYVGLNTPSAGQFILGHYATASDWVGGSFDMGTFYNNSIKTNAGSKEEGIFWRSPSWGGFSVGLNYLPKQDFTGTTDEKKDPGYGIGFKYAASNWGIGLGYDELSNDSKNDTTTAEVTKDGGGAISSGDTVTVVTTESSSAVTDPLGESTWTVFDSWFTFSNYKIALGLGNYTTKADGENTKESSFDYAGLGLQGTWGPHQLSVTYGQRMNYKINGEKPDEKPKATNMSLDYAYELSARTKIGGGFAQTKDTNNGATGTDTVGDVGVENGSKPGAEDKTSRSFGVGVKHTF